MMDLQHAEEEFEKYLDGYDRDNDRSVTRYRKI